MEKLALNHHTFTQRARAPFFSQQSLCQKPAWLLGAHPTGQQVQAEQQVKDSALSPQGCQSTSASTTSFSAFTGSDVLFKTSSSLTRRSAGHLHPIILSLPAKLHSAQALGLQTQKAPSHSHVLYGLCSPSSAVCLGVNSVASYIFSDWRHASRFGTCLQLTWSNSLNCAQIVQNHQFIHFKIHHSRIL